MRISKITMAVKIIFSLSVLLLTLAACNANTPNKHENDKTIITSCNNLGRVAVRTLSAQEQRDVCGIMLTDLQRTPPAYLLHDFIRLVALVKETASTESANLIAMQAMDIVKTRQQQGNDQAMESTFDTLWLIYQDTETQVSFEDLNNALRKSGKAKDISDDLLMKWGITLSEQRNRAREKNVMNAVKDMRRVAPLSNS